MISFSVFLNIFFSVLCMSVRPDERELAAAIDVLRSVITSTRTTPRATTTAPINYSEPSVVFPSHVPSSGRPRTRDMGTQCEAPQVPIEGLVKAAGRSFVNFAEELRSLERTVEANHRELLTQIKQLRLDKFG